MSRRLSSLIYLALAMLVLVMAAAITIYRSEMKPIDPQFTVGLSLITASAAITSFGGILALLAAVAVYLRRPGTVVIWALIASVLVVLARWAFGGAFGLTSPAQQGWIDAWLMYLPVTVLLCLLAGWSGQMVRPIPGHQTGQ